MFDFAVIVKNNTGAEVPAHLLDTAGLRGTYNSNIKFSCDISAASLTGIESVSVQVRSNGTTDLMTYTAKLLTPTVQGVVDALNSLNVGIFWFIGNIIYTANSLFTYTNIVIGDPLVVAFTASFNSTATIMHTIDLTSNSLSISGRVDWGDGNFDNFSSTTPMLTHNYAVPGLYNVIVYMETPLTFVQVVKSNANELAAIGSLGNLASLETLTIQGNELTTLDISGNPLLTNLSVDSNNLPTTVINTLLILLDGFGLLNGTFTSPLQIPPAPPSGAGIVAAGNLTGKGWLVSTD